MEVQNLTRLLAKLKAKVAEAESVGKTSVIVGFTAAYAAAVHENIEMSWKGLSRDPRIRRIEAGGDPAKSRPRPRKREPKGRFWDPQGRGQAKFLEEPARTMTAVFSQIVVQAMRAGKTFGQALLLVGLRIQREAMLRTPIDTGNLRASAFCRYEE